MSADNEIKDSGMSTWEFWTDAITSALREKDYTKWVHKSQNIVARYRDERYDRDRYYTGFNILWANVQLQIPALFGQIPKPSVTRRNKDDDPVALTAAMMLERCLEYEVEQYTDFNSTMESCVEDRLLCGRGTAWVRFEESDGEVYEDDDVIEGFEGGDFDDELDAGEIYDEEFDDGIDDEFQDGLDTQVSENRQQERAGYECAPSDYVYWKDFIVPAARSWEEVPWIARRVYLGKVDVDERFPGNPGVPYNFQNSTGDDELHYSDEPKSKSTFNKKAEIFEIWDSRTRKVYWIAKGYDKLLDEKDDPLELEGFFPCPKPLFATTTTGSLIPVPDYCEYQDQAIELDTLTQRISLLTQSLRITGVYNAEYPAIQSLAQGSSENQLVPVDSWAAMAEKGGLRGAMELMPIDQIAMVMTQLQQAREVVKQSIYELTGISDILRGASAPAETFGAQQLKANFGSLRLKSSQMDVSRFAAQLFKMKAQIICKFFRPETIYEMSGIKNTPDEEHFDAALDLLRGNLRDFYIDVTADTLAQIDDQKEKKEGIEFVGAVGTYLREALPVIQTQPQTGPLLAEILLFSIRKFKAGRSLETTFERAIDDMKKAQKKIQEQGDQNGEQLQVAMQQMQLQLQSSQQENQKLEEENQNLKQDIQGDIIEAQLEARLDKFRTDNELQIKRQELAMKEIESNHKMQLKEMEIRHSMQLKEVQLGVDSAIKSATLPDVGESRAAT